VKPGAPPKPEESPLGGRLENDELPTFWDTATERY